MNDKLLILCNKIDGNGMDIETLSETKDPREVAAKLNREQVRCAERMRLLEQAEDLLQAETFSRLDRINELSIEQNKVVEMARRARITELRGPKAA